MELSKLGEVGLIERIKELVAPSLTQEVLQGIDDDCAVIRTSEEDALLLTSDLLIEGVHFDLTYFDFFNVGWRAMAANLSDIAAMAGTPKHTTVSIALPKEMTTESVDSLYRGMLALTDRFGVAIVGGDTTKSAEKLFVAITVLGEVEPEQLTLRSAAQAGDAIFVTGDLGRAHAGFVALTQDPNAASKFNAAVEKHFSPMPRLHEAKYLVENFEIHAMIDLSDGLSTDLRHICQSSQVGALLDEECLPIHNDTKNIAEAYGEQPLEYVLHGGEDFELLFTSPQEAEQKIVDGFVERFRYPCTKIGNIHNRSDEMTLERSNGRKQAVTPRGYDHFH